MHGHQVLADRRHAYERAGQASFSKQIDLPAPFAGGQVTVAFSSTNGEDSNTYTGEFEATLQLNQSPVNLQVTAELQRSDGASTLTLTGTSSFNLASLPSVKFKEFKLSATVTITEDGSTGPVMKALSFGGGVSGSLGSGTGLFSYENETTSFDLTTSLSLPKPFKVRGRGYAIPFRA